MIVTRALRGHIDDLCLDGNDSWTLIGPGDRCSHTFPDNRKAIPQRCLEDLADHLPVPEGTSKANPRESVRNPGVGNITGNEDEEAVNDRLMGKSPLGNQLSTCESLQAL